LGESPLHHPFSNERTLTIRKNVDYNRFPYKKVQSNNSSHENKKIMKSHVYCGSGKIKIKNIPKSVLEIPMDTLVQ